MQLRKAWEFFRRDLLIESGYKSSFIIDLVSSLQPVFVFYFIGQLVGEQPRFAQYKGGYFEFALCGIAISRYFTTALFIFSTTIRRAQTSGCLEAILSSRTHSGAVIMCSSLYGFIASGLHIIVIFLCGWLFFGTDLSQLNIVATLAALALSAFSLCGLGILSAAFILILKRGDPLEWLFSAILTLLCGAYFPLEMFPHWLQKAAYYIPLTHALDALRAAINQGEGVVVIWPHLLFMAVAGAVLIPCSMFAFTKAVEAGRQDGSLGHY